MAQKTIIYTAPLKALSHEKFHEWSKGVFHDKKIVMLTGDTLTSQKVRRKMMAECEGADIVLMTSELLDSLTRNHASESYAWLYNVVMLIVDECHIIASPGRGDCVEVAIMRFSQINPQAKIWLLSATATNIHEFTSWLSRLNNKSSYALNSSWRPTTLVWHYLQHSIFGSYVEIQADKIYKSVGLVKEKPTEKFLIFVWDKNTGRNLVGALADEKINAVFYNADLEYEERTGILQQFESDADPLQVIVSTSALAWGVNTSAQNVILVGNHRGLEEVDELDIIQAAGRAGRFGKSPEGHVYFICDSVTGWEARIANPKPVLSTLLDLDLLAFHLCAEIRNKVIYDVPSMHAWYVRTLSCIQQELTPEKVEEVVAHLVQWECVRLNDDGRLQCTSLGVVAATLYYHPKDVYHWGKSLEIIDRQNLWDNDYAIAYLLATPSAQLPYIARKDEVRVSTCTGELRKVWDGRIKSSTLFADLVDLLRGEKPSMPARQIRQDADRIGGALTWIAGIRRIVRQGQVGVLPLRLKYGVPADVAVLCQLPKLGGARAKKLYDAGIKTIAAIASSESQVKRLLGVAIGTSVVEAARNFVPESE